MGGKFTTFQKFRYSRKREKFRDATNTWRREYRSLENAFREIYTYAKCSCEPGDYLGKSFDESSAWSGRTIASSGTRFNFQRYIGTMGVSSIAQSAGGIDIAENFDVRVFNIATPVGRRRKSNRFNTRRRSKTLCN